MKRHFAGLPKAILIRTKSSRRMVHAFIAVGSNLGNRQGHLDEARHLAAQSPGFKILRVSPVYETDPVGGPPQGKYLNAVWEIETDRDPTALLQALNDIERRLGRNREKEKKNFPRTMDLDILFYGDKVVRLPGLVIPHPRLHERAFVLDPLADLAPDWVHPELKKTIRQLQEEIHAGHSKS